jgi:hypothetical protein
MKYNLQMTTVLLQIRICHRIDEKMNSGYSTGYRKKQKPH